MAWRKTLFKIRKISVEDSGKECNNGAHDVPPDEHFPKEVKKNRGSKKWEEKPYIQ